MVIAVVALFVLAATACRLFTPAAETAPTTVATAASAATFPAQVETALPATVSPAVTASVTAGAVEGGGASPTADVASHWQPGVVDGRQDVPAPTLFDVQWEDRSVFEPNLIDPGDAHSATLAGASVYHIELTLDDNATRYAGRQEILYTNQEEIELLEIYLRLFPNLADGRMQVTSSWINGLVVTPSYELNNSAMRLPLDPPLKPGEQVVIALAYDVRLPTMGGGNYGTFIYSRDVLALAHFYPMVAVFDDEGWNVEIAPVSGDVVYSDSAFYLVRVDALAELRMAASGVEIADSGEGARQVVTYAAGPARDFYLAASARFDVYSRQVGDVLVNSYAFAEVEPAARLVLDWTVASVQTFNELIGPYPYRELDVVATPTMALGVEYPGIFVLNMDLYDPQSHRYAPFVLHATVAHEAAHQWFYAVVGNDQVDEPWLDESLAQYVTYLYLLEAGETVAEAQDGEDAAQIFYDSLVQRWESVDRADIAVGQPVAAYQGPTYGAIVYGRGPLFFEALAAEMGASTFDAFLRRYYEELKWDIATSQRLQALAEAQCSCELDALFDEWIYGE